MNWMFALSNLYIFLVKDYFLLSSMWKLNDSLKEKYIFSYPFLLLWTYKKYYRKVNIIDV